MEFMQKVRNIKIIFKNKVVSDTSVFHIKKLGLNQDIIVN